MTRALAVVLALAALSAAAALGAGPGPDSHDRALVQQLDASTQIFAKMAAQKGGLGSVDKSLDRCPRQQREIGKLVDTAASATAFAKQFNALEAAVVTQAVDVVGPEYRGFRQMMLAMHPHSRLFARWLAAEEQHFALLLRFDNHGKKIDLCKAVAVALDKSSTGGDIHRVLGLDLSPSLISALDQRLYQNSVPAALAVKIRAFFVAAGLPAAGAKHLSSN